MSTPDRRSRRDLGQETSAGGDDLLREDGIRHWRRDVHTRPEYRPGASAGGERALMGDGVDTGCEPRDDREAGSHCTAGRRVRHAPPKARRVARTHDRYGADRWQGAAHPQHLRWEGDRTQVGWVAGLVDPYDVSWEQSAGGSA